MVAYNERAVPVHREVQVGEYVMRDKYSVKRCRLQAFTRPPCRGWLALLEHFGKLRHRYPARHGLVFLNCSTPLGVSPASPWRSRIEVTQKHHTVALFSGLCRQIAQCCPDYRSDCPVCPLRNMLVDSNELPCEGGVWTLDLDALYAALYSCCTVLLTDQPFARG